MKRTLLYNLLIGLLFISVQLSAADADFPFEKTRDFKYKYAVGPSTQLFITNSYGRISLKSWDKDSILVLVKIIARAKTPVESEKLLNYASIEEYNGPISVMFKTVFGKDASIIERSKLNIQEAVGDREVGVEYTVFAPSDLVCNLENRFGDIFLSDWRANLNLKLSYGDVRGGSSKGNVGLNLKYGKAYFSTLEKLTIDATYSEVTAEKITSLFTKSLSTKYNIGKCWAVQLGSKNDKVFFESVEGLSGTTFLSVISVGRVAGNVNLSCKYGEVMFNLVQAKVNQINLSGNGTDFSLTFETGSTIAADLTLTSEKHVNYGTDFKVIQDTRVDKKHILSLKKGAETRTRLVLNAVSAYVNIVTD